MRKYYILVFLIFMCCGVYDAYAATNLLTNPGAEEGDTTGWSNVVNGGDGWAFDWDNVIRTGSYSFQSSYAWCSMDQTVDLTGTYTAAQLDAQPNIIFSIWVTARADKAVQYYVTFKLLESDGTTVVASWNDGTSASPTTRAANTGWTKITHTFSSYGTGVRKAYFKIGGRDNQNPPWAGCYGAHFDDASVTIPPTLTFNPLDNSADIAVSSNITISFNNEVRNIDDSALTNDNIDALITLKDTDVNGDNISFDAVIDSDKKIITITPTKEFLEGQVIYVAIGATLEDSFDNAITASNATFTAAGTANHVTDAVTRKPMQGVIITLYTASGRIYTGRIQANPTVTDAEGKYNLEAESGRYYITATKEGYEDYQSALFSVNSPVAVAITMIPLNQSQGSHFTILNQVDKKVATTGDVLTYRVIVSNLKSSNASGVTVSASLPHDFRVVNGSVKVDGVRQDDPLDHKNPSFSLSDISASSTKVLTYRVIIGPDAKRGKNKNFANVSGIIDEYRTQGPAIATVDIREGVFSKLGMLVGKVYNDKNKNGIQDEGEEGIPGVAVILDDGTTVITDEYGRYSVPEISSGIHAVRLDQRVLPGGPLYPAIKEVKKENGEPLIQRRTLSDWVKEKFGNNKNNVK